MQPSALMKLAIEKARAGVEAGQSPFGCVIARHGQPVAVSHNTVLASTDITAHAEINALRAACRQSGEIHLQDCVAVTTCEPCPMCMAALHWARVDTVYYGASIADATAAGFNELRVSASDLARQGGSTVELRGGVLANECRELFEIWLQRDERRSY